MKLQQLVVISEKVWVSAFSANLEERGAAKKLQLFKLLVDGRSEDTIAKTLYGNIAAERRKKTLNQSLSELYAEYLRFLLIHFRNYPELLLFHLKGALIEADEERFYLLADVIERTFIDTSNHEALVSLYYILRDHYFYKVTKPVLYKEHCAKLDNAVDNLREFHALESYFVNNDLSRKSMKTSGTEADFQLHREYFEEYFLKEKPLRTQLLARLFWLRCYYSFNYDTLTSARPREVASELWQLLKKRPYVYVNYPEFLQFSNLSYRIYTDHARLDIKEFNSLFEDYHKLFDDPWILALYPRMYQA